MLSLKFDCSVEISFTQIQFTNTSTNTYFLILLNLNSVSSNIDCFWQVNHINI